MSLHSQVDGKARGVRHASHLQRPHSGQIILPLTRPPEPTPAPALTPLRSDEGEGGIGGGDPPVELDTSNGRVIVIGGLDERIVDRDSRVVGKVEVGEIPCWLSGPEAWWWLNDEDFLKDWGCFVMVFVRGGAPPKALCNLKQETPTVRENTYINSWLVRNLEGGRK